MSFMILTVAICSFYGIIWFIDSFFKSCMMYPYYAFLEGTGLKVGFFSITWTTTAFNRIIFRWSKNLSKILKRWFSVGYKISLYLFLPFSLWTLFSLIVEHFYKNVEISSVSDVKAMLPGINIPLADFWIYFFAIALSSALHELGHAMAAVHEDVQLIGVGFYVFTIMPMAFVQLNTEHLNSIPVFKRLKIYCAGIWHNVVTAFIAILIFFSTPILFSFGYDSDTGVRVTEFTYDSPLKLERGLAINDVVVSINSCPVRDIHDWNYCLHVAYERYGICMSAEYVAQNDEILMETVKENNVIECCRKEDIQSFCFEYMEPKHAEESLLPGQYSCLKPRDMIKNDFQKCTESTGYMCPKAMHCLKPSLNNHTYLIVLERKNNFAVLYLGLPYDIHKTVFVDHYFPKYKIFSLFSPQQFEKFIRYIFIFSMGIGFLNIIPCYGTDGHHIARSLIQIIAKYLNKDSDFVTFFTIFTVAIGTLLTIPTIAFLFYKALTDT